MIIANIEESISIDDHFGYVVVIVLLKLLSYMLTDRTVTKYDWKENSTVYSNKCY